MDAERVISLVRVLAHLFKMCAQDVLKSRTNVGQTDFCLFSSREGRPTGGITLEESSGVGIEKALE